MPNTVHFNVERGPILLATLPLRRTPRGGRGTGNVELLFQGLDVGLKKFAQFGNLQRKVVARDLILFYRSLGGPAGGPAGWRCGGLDVIGDGCRDAFVGGAPDAVAVERDVDPG